MHEHPRAQSGKQFHLDLMSHHHLPHQTGLWAWQQTLDFKRKSFNEKNGSLALFNSDVNCLLGYPMLTQ
jgi:hypothetical protein